MFICTESGSVYEIDFAKRMLRRLRGKATRVLTEGAWKLYEHVIATNGRLIFFWGHGEQQFQMTTTPVISVSSSLGLA